MREISSPGAAGDQLRTNVGFGAQHQATGTARMGAEQTPLWVEPFSDRAAPKPCT
jgi:hypothetical protein